MHKSKIIKVIIILAISFITILNLNIKVLGSTDPIENANYYKPSTSISEPELEKKAGVILGGINVVGVIVSVVTLMIVGIKYMFGSVEEKAEYKKTMTMYLIGAVLVFSITTIPNILYKIASSI